MSKRKADDFPATSFQATKRQNINKDDDGSDDKKPMQTMFNSPVLSDIQLSFEDNKKLFAHKVVLSAYSIVFRQLFHDIWPLSNTFRTMSIKKCSENIFMQVLRFCYNLDVQLTADNVYQVMVTSSFFKIKDLEDICSMFVINDLNVSNVCHYLSQCYNDNNDVAKKCFSFLDEKISEIIDQNYFNLNTRGVLMKVLERNELNICEFKLFNAIHKFLGGKWDPAIVKLIRFPTLKLNEFKQCCTKWAFTTQEIKDIELMISEGEISPTLTFSWISRDLFVAGEVNFQYSESVSKLYAVRMEFMVAKKIKIKEFYFNDHCTDCDHHYFHSDDVDDSPHNGLRLVLDGKIIFECRKIFYCTDLTAPILLTPENKYVLDTWVVGHKNSSECKCNFSIFKNENTVFKNFEENRSFVRTVKYDILK